MPRLGPHAAATFALAALAAASLLAGTASAVGEKDWIDSPITVGNKSPPGNVTVSQRPCPLSRPPKTHTRPPL